MRATVFCGTVELNAVDPARHGGTEHDTERHRVRVGLCRDQRRNVFAPDPQVRRAAGADTDARTSTGPSRAATGPPIAIAAAIRTTDALIADGGADRRTAEIGRLMRCDNRTACDATSMRRECLVEFLTNADRIMDKGVDSWGVTTPLAPAHGDSGGCRDSEVCNISARYLLCNCHNCHATVTEEVHPDALVVPLDGTLVEHRLWPEGSLLGDEIDPEQAVRPLVPRTPPRCQRCGELGSGSWSSPTTAV